MQTHLVAPLVGMSNSTQSASDAATSRRLGRFRIGTFTLAALALALTWVAAAAAQDAQAAPDASVGSVHFAVGQRVCKAAKAHYATCFAVRRVEVPAGTPGALRYEIAAGAGLKGLSLAEAMVGRAATIGPNGGLTPSDLATAYGYAPTSTGASQTVAIVDAYNDPNINADLQTFDTQYGLLACSIANGCLKVVNQTGGSTLPANDTSGWAVEESLDVETVHAVCEKCKIILIEANSNSNADLAAAENEAAALHATEISNSYGGAEVGGNATVNAAYNHPGIAIIASAGDDGYYNFQQLGNSSPSPYNQPNAPAALTTVLAVGGTSLYLGQTATRQSETVWNDNGTTDYFQRFIGQGLGATGGGCSNLYTAPAWQHAVPGWSKTACGTHRLVSDIAADADYLTGLDIYSSYNCGSSCSVGWQTLGGTSLAAPIIAGMFGIAGGSHGFSNPALTLYGHLGGPSLYNITTGGNGWCDGEGAASCGDPNTMGDGILDCDYPASGTTPSVGNAACDAGVGFNGPTGIGTPIGLGAFAKTGPTVSIAGPTSVKTGVTNTWTATATDPFPGGKIASYTWDWGDANSPTVTTVGSATHSYGSSGTFTFTLTVKDTYGVTGTQTYSVTVTN